MFNTGCWLPQHPSLVSGSPEGNLYCGWYLAVGAVVWRFCWRQGHFQDVWSFNWLWLLIRWCEMCSQQNGLLYAIRRVDVMKLELAVCQIMTAFLWTKNRFLDLAPCMQPREYGIKDGNCINWNNIKCAVCCSGYEWFGNVSVDKLHNRIIKTRPLKKWKLQELVERLFEYSGYHVRLKINSCFLCKNSLWQTVKCKFCGSCMYLTHSV